MIDSKSSLFEPQPLIISLQYPSKVLELMGIFIHRHVRALLDAGLDLRLVSPQPFLPGVLKGFKRWRGYGGEGLDDQYGGVNILRPRYIHIPGPILRHLIFLGLGLKLARYVSSGRAGFIPNLIHVHRVYPEGLVGLVTAHRLGLPLVCTARGSDIHSLPQESAGYKRIAQEVIRRAGSFVSVSRRLADQALALAGCDRDVSVIYNGIDVNHFCANPEKTELRRVLGLPVEGKLLLFVGRFETAKGARELLQSFQFVRAQIPNVHLVIVGRNVYGQGLTSGGTEEYLNVHLMGEVAPERVVPYLQACDIFVFPSHAEGMPNAMLEAMAVGLPVVATPVGGVPEVIVDGENGLLVPVENAAKLAEKLLSLVKDDDLASALGAKAAATVREMFSWHRNAQEHIALYSEVLERWRSRTK